MVKTVTSHSLQVVTFSTTLPISEVLSRLDKEVAKPASGAPALSLARGAPTSKEDLQMRVESAVGPSGFLYFNEYNHGWLKLYSSTPQVVIYVIGNPIIGQTMLQYDLRGAYNIPPRLLVLQKADGAGTDVIYHLPSSVMVLDHNERLKTAVEALDSKLESLVERITAV
ncbi:hypothetical protein B0H17DRAFT_1048270 [Mycena rosella]|uniref:TT1751-like protein n=1 Tax=Mycena rosella TaxID=1033263 RepID=A0AAD7DUF0_MYCRO|nr:hypothetical protein B0H17DRAFT_1048270 [Mycena rosella]